MTLKTVLRSSFFAMLILPVGIPFVDDAQGQVRGRGARWYRSQAVNVGVIYGVGGGYGYGIGATIPYGPYGYGSTVGFGSTVGWGRTHEGDYLRGMASVIRAQGAAQRDRSQAALNYQQAQKAYIENQKAWNSVYRERVQLSRVYREREKAKQDALRERIRARRELAQDDQKTKQKERLTASQLDPYTGKIHWPTGLLFSDGIDLRLQIEELFATRIETGATHDLNLKIREKTRELEKMFRKKIADMPSEDYFAARSFLDLLVQETAHVTN